METVNYRITEGSEFGWRCFGCYAYRLDSWNEDNENGNTVTIIFDTKTQVVYQMEAYDYKNQRAYRWNHPDYVKLYFDDAKRRKVREDEAWEDVNFTDLEVEEDMLEKARSIVAEEDYDTDIMIALNLTDDETFTLMKKAHELDITFNQYMSNVIMESVKRLQESLDSDNQESHLPSLIDDEDSDY